MSFIDRNSLGRQAGYIRANSLSLSLSLFEVHVHVCNVLRWVVGHTLTWRLFGAITRPDRIALLDLRDSCFGLSAAEKVP